MTKVDWSKWHKLPEPVRKPGWKDARVTVGCGKDGLIAVGFNNQALKDLGILEAIQEEPRRCDIYEGLAGELGKIFVRWSKEGAYQLASVFGGKAGRIIRIETEWAPELQQKAQPCKYVIIEGQGIEITLPKWFPRELFEEDQRRDAAE